MESKLIINEINRMRQMMRLPVIQESRLTENKKSFYKKLLMEGKSKALKQLTKSAVQAVMGTLPDTIRVSLPDGVDASKVFRGAFKNVAEMDLSDAVANLSDIVLREELEALAKSSPDVLNVIVDTILRDDESKERIIEFSLAKNGPIKDIMRKNIEDILGAEDDIIVTELKNKVSTEVSQRQADILAKEAADAVAASSRASDKRMVDALSNEAFLKEASEFIRDLDQISGTEGWIINSQQWKQQKGLIKKFFTNKKAWLDASPELYQRADDLARRLSEYDPNLAQKVKLRVSEIPLINKFTGKLAWAAGLFGTYMTAYYSIYLLVAGGWVTCMEVNGPLSSLVSNIMDPLFCKKTEEKSGTKSETKTETETETTFTISDVETAYPFMKDKLKSKDNNIYFVGKKRDYLIIKKGNDYFLKGDNGETNLKDLN